MWCCFCEGTSPEKDVMVKPWPLDGMTGTLHVGMTSASISQEESLRSRDHASLCECDNKCCTADVIIIAWGNTHERTVTQLHSTYYKRECINMFFHKARACRFIML